MKRSLVLLSATGIFTVILGVACSQKSVRIPAATSTNELPSLKNLSASSKAIEAALKKAGVPAAHMATAKDKLQKYLEFIGLDPKLAANERAFERVLNSSTAFLFCDDLNDWSCLEAKPLITPATKWRTESVSDLGKPVKLARPFNYKYFFTEQYTLPKESRNLEKSLAQELAKVISENWTEIKLALFGIDDINGSMKSVYQGLIEKRKQGANISAVLDTDGFGKLDGDGKVIFSHQGLKSGGKNELAFQYDGTLDLVRELNSGVKSDLDTRARFEWPDGGIMHNKFLIFKNAKSTMVWTGTANIAQTCMGEETNANMSILIDDADIGQAFETEFAEMFTFSKEKFTDSKKKIVGADGNPQIPVGKFHRNKSPNTKRYFTFNDGTEVRVHFSPTDDGEHRVLIPLLLSANAGDEIRIAMFGSGGLELVRALQFAAAQGAKIKIAFDNMLSSVPGSWVKGEVANLLEKNPYNPKAEVIEIKKSNWKGVNHHKTATLTRTVGGKKVAEVLIIGSQNWSVTGNDESDENMVTVRNIQKGVAGAEAFNKHFDSQIWPNSKY